MNRMIRLLITILIIAAFGINLRAQKPFRLVADKFSSCNQYFASEVNRKTLQLYVKEKYPTPNVREVLESIDELKVLSFSTIDSKMAEQFITEIKNRYSINNYSPFKIVKQGENNQLVYLKENGETISNLLLINTNFSKMSLVEITGKINISKIALLKEVLHLDGLDGLTLLNDRKIENSPTQKENKPKKNKIPKEFFPEKGGMKVYDKHGNLLINSQQDPTMLINGYKVKEDVKKSLASLSPNCIQSINVIQPNEKSSTDQNGLIDVLLKGNLKELYTICEGVLYFGQNGYLQSIIINDNCSPALLCNCKQKPLSEIMKYEPKQIKSIALTKNPPNCNGPVEGEFVVVEFN